MLVEGLLYDCKHEPTVRDINQAISKYANRKETWGKLPEIVQVHPGVDLGLTQIKTICRKEQVTLSIITDKSLAYRQHIRVGYYIQNGNGAKEQ